MKPFQGFGASFLVLMQHTITIIIKCTTGTCGGAMASATQTFMPQPEKKGYSEQLEQDTDGAVQPQAKGSWYSAAGTEQPVQRWRNRSQRAAVVACRV